MDGPISPMTTTARASARNGNPSTWPNPKLRAQKSPCLRAEVGIWYWRAGSVSVDTVASPRIEMFYWTAVLFSQTLGTALGDWMADSKGLGYERGALVFAAGVVAVASAYFCTNVSPTLLFWSAFILTRPLGATVGDFLDRPVANGGLAFGRFYASAILATLIVACIVLLPQRAGKHPETT
jgi:uncharacterized membrane-anchored protein